MFENFKVHAQLILGEAAKRGIKIEEVNPGKLAKLTFRAHTEYLLHEFFSTNTAVASKLCRNKGLTRHILQKSNIKVAAGGVFKVTEFDAAKAMFNHLKKPLVLKSPELEKAKSIVLGIDSEEKFKEAWDKLSSSVENTELIIEEQFAGDEYRIFVTKDKFVAASKRIPANIVGDGEKNIKELVDDKNAEPGRMNEESAERKTYPIVLDQTVIDNLSESDINLDYVPAKGEMVLLRKNSNLATGGESINCTEVVDDKYKELALSIVRAIPGLTYAGIDLMTTNISDYDRSNYIIVEVNSSPGITAHQNPCQGESVDVAAAIIDVVFPETKRTK